MAPIPGVPNRCYVAERQGESETAIPLPQMGSPRGWLESS